MGYLKAALVGATTSLLCALLLLSTAYARADERDPQSFDIRPQGLAAALSEFARQSHEEILFAPDVVAEKRSGGVRGTMQPLAALKVLLNDSGLPFSSTPSGAILIGQAGASPVISAGHAGDSSQKEGKKNSSQDFRLAQVDQGANSQSPTLGNSASRPQDSSQKGQLAEIIVTAQKRSERVQDVPISIAVLTADELQKREVTSIDDLSFAVPGLSVQNSGSYQRRIVLRGISNLSGNSSLIGVYLDEADVTSNPSYQLDLRTYDLERVEVLRGPQGTLYGEGSVGGTIRFITKNPVLDRFAMNADVAALFTQNGAPGQRIEEVANVPVIENELGLRIAGTFDHEGGWIDQPDANQRNFNGQDVADVRVKALWQPAAQVAVNAMVLIHRNDASPNLGEDQNGDYTQPFNLATTPSGKDDFDVYNLTFAYDFPLAQLLSTTSYIDQNKQTENYGIIYQATPPGTPPYDEYYPRYVASYNTTNEELRLTSTGSGPWQWTVGGFYRYFKSATDVPSYYFGFPGPPGTALPSPFSYQSNNLSRSWAVFGDTNYKIADRLTLGMGLRYFEDDEENRLSGQTARFHTLNPRAYAEYKLTEAVNAYASAGKGFRSGGFNAPTQPTYGPESVWTYELGTKISLLQNRLSADAAVFYSNYSNYQVYGIPPLPAQPIGITSDAGRATIKGIEWDLTWRPADEWSLGFHGNYLVNYKFTEINTIAYSNGAPSTAYAVGDSLPLVQKHTFSESLERDFKWNGKAGFARLDYSQSGRETYGDRSVGPWYHSESDIINLLNFNTRLQWNDSLSLGVFVQNLLNNRGFTDPFSIEAAAARLRPRTYGVEFGVTF